MTGHGLNPGGPTPAGGADDPQLLERRRVMAARFFFAAGAGLAISAFLPWLSILTIAQVHLTGGQIVVVLAFGGAYAGAGYLVQQGRATSTLALGLWALDALMALLIILFFHALGGLGNEVVSAGAGLFVAGIAVVAGIVATVQLHRSGAPLPRPMAAAASATEWLRSRASAPRVPGAAAAPAATRGVPPPPGAEISPDGYYWWDERASSWRLMPEPRPASPPSSSPLASRAEAPASSPPAEPLTSPAEPPASSPPAEPLTSPAEPPASSRVTEDAAAVDRCPNGHSVESGDAFCAHCGAPVERARPAP